MPAPEVRRLELQRRARTAVAHFGPEQRQL